MGANSRSSDLKESTLALSYIALHEEVLIYPILFDFQINKNSIFVHFRRGPPPHTYAIFFLKKKSNFYHKMNFF